jgi:hypothetical protein
MNPSVRYVDNYTSLMTPNEFAAFKWLSLEAKAKSCDSEAMQRMIRSRWLGKWQSNDQETLALIEMGWEGLLQHVHDRILRDHPNEVGRCPNCRRLTATRQAKQCFGCGHDWHDAVFRRLE